MWAIVQGISIASDIRVVIYYILVTSSIYYNVMYTYNNILCITSIIYYIVMYTCNNV